MGARMNPASKLRRFHSRKQWETIGRCCSICVDTIKIAGGEPSGNGIGTRGGTKGLTAGWCAGSINININIVEPSLIG